MSAEQSSIRSTLYVILARIATDLVLSCDLELMLLDRGVEVDHTTIFRWIQTYAVELERRIRLPLRISNGSWRVDETYVKVKGR